MSKEDKGAKSLFFDESFDTVDLSNDTEKISEDIHSSVSSSNGRKKSGCGCFVWLLLIIMGIIFILNMIKNKENDDVTTENNATTEASSVIIYDEEMYIITTEPILIII